MKNGIHTTKAFRFAVICIIGAAIAFAFQLHRMRATYFEGEIVPSDNDAFYHARRILDTVKNPAEFYEFDPRIHAPEGSLVVWPWGFDYAIASVVRFSMSAGLASDPMVALAYVPPFAVILSISMATLLAWNLGLTTAATALLALSIAVSPLTQAIHGIACVDHHFAEYVFILSFLGVASGWMRNRSSPAWAAATGLVLGLAPSMHTLLFILQAPLLMTLALLWWRKEPIDGLAAAVFGFALVVVTASVAAFSQPFREGYFEHFYLSWFHVYVASCTVLLIALLSRLPTNGRNALKLVVAALALAVPLLSQIAQASGYLGNENQVLQEIGEAKSFWRLFLQDGWVRMARLYSGLVLLAPATAIGCLLAIRRLRDGSVLLICVYSLLAIPLLLAQFRFHYYGSISLAVPLLLLSDHHWRQRPRRTFAALGIIAIFLVAHIPSTRYAIASETTVGRDPYFILTRLAMPELADACQEDPGIVLAKNNEGHFIRYYTECSVIANNFLLTPQHVRAFYSVAELFGRTPDELVNSDIPIKYVLVRARGAVATSTDGSRYMLVDKEDAQMISDPLTDALLWGNPANAPASFRLVAEIPAPGKDYPYARIWKIVSQDD